jgi:hypothetical protein
MRIKKILLTTLCCAPLLVASNPSTGTKLLEEILLVDSSAKPFISNPFLIFRENKKMDERKFHWNVDVIVATENLPASAILTCEMNEHNANGPSPVTEVLYQEPENGKLKSKKFFKTSFSLQRVSEQYSQPYCLKLDKDIKCTGIINVPGLNEKLHFITTSCNGFHSPEDAKLIGSRENTWSQILAQHKEKETANHLMVGLGDQLYCDEVFKLEELQPWLSKKFNIEEFNAIEPTEEVTAAVDQFYFHRYLEEFSKNTPSFSECLSSIPQMNIWDDHDIFDGYGSLPPLLQNSPMVQMIGSIAKKYYLLFQQGIRPNLTKKEAIEQGYLSNSNYSFFKTIGSTTFMAMDTRSERDCNHVMAPASFTQLLGDIKNHITDDTKHLVVLSATPIVYPNKSLISDITWWCANPYAWENRIWRKFTQWFGTKIASLSVLGNDGANHGFDLDTWNSHKEEKIALINALQNISKSRNIRTTILAGDAHQAGVAAIAPRTPFTSSDPRIIMQFLTSPVGNVPLQLSSRMLIKYNEYLAAKTILRKDFQEITLKWQLEDSAPYFLQRRNWININLTVDNKLLVRLNSEIPNSTPPRFESFRAAVVPV